MGSPTFLWGWRGRTRIGLAGRRKGEIGVRSGGFVAGMVQLPGRRMGRIGDFVQFDIDADQLRLLIDTDS